MRPALALVAVVTTACATMPRVAPSAEVSPQAERIYRQSFVVDTHNDLPSKMLDDGYTPDVRHRPGFAKDEGETDLPRLFESGISAQFLSAFVDASYAHEVPDGSYRRVLAYLDTIHAFVDR